MRLVATPRQRRNGSYYTSERVAEAVARWALAAGGRRVLDPSFGGCAFLRVALRLLAEMEMADAGEGIYGVDVDRFAFSHTQDLVEGGVPPSNLIRADFFSVTRDELGGRFDCVVGNPPYIRHHSLSTAQRDRARRVARRAGIELDGRADLWAYFVAGSLPLLKKGGRLALLLPGAVLQADYAEPLLTSLERRAASLELIIVRKRLFDDAAERTVVLLLDGLDNGSCRRMWHSVEDESALELLLSSLPRSPLADIRGNAGKDVARERTRWKWQAAGLPQASRELFERTCKCEGISRLSEMASTRLGVVTGANQFFVRTVEEARSLECFVATSVPIVSRAAWLKAPRWSAPDQTAIEEGGRPCRLLAIKPNGRLPAMLKTAIEAAKAEGFHERSHCWRREPWFSLRDVAAPDAFLPYMSASTPRLVANEVGATCTNAIHRVTWKQGVQSAGGIAGAWTSLFRLGAEVVGRSYGGGVLKLELGAAASLPIPGTSTPADLQEIDAIARKEGRKAACRLADDLVLRNRLGLSRGEITCLRDAADAMAAAR